VAHFLPPDSSKKNKDVMDMGLRALQIAKESGVTMCYGSDLLGPLGKYQAREFGLRSEVLPALDILQSATVNPARIMGQNRLGQVKPGFLADILVLKSNPLDDITVFERWETSIQLVVKDGRVCWSGLTGVTGILNGFDNM
jgi:Imidazolonepropionase and related amidohydrolases